MTDFEGFSSVETLHEEVENNLDKFREHIRFLKTEFSRDGDLSHLDIASLTQEDMKHWNEYKRLLDDIENILSIEDESARSTFFSERLDSFKSIVASFGDSGDGRSQFVGFINNRVTPILAIPQLKKFLETRGKPYDMWEKLSSEVESQKRLYF